VRTLISLIFIFLLSLTTIAQQPNNPKSPSFGTFGFGPITGNHPWVGATAKLWLGEKLAIDAVVGYQKDVELQANLTSNRSPFNLSNGNLFFTYGLGVFSKIPTADALGVQAIGGAEWFLPWEPVSVFADYIPAVNFNPKQDKAFQPLNFVGGIRYYF